MIGCRCIDYDRRTIKDFSHPLEEKNILVPSWAPNIFFYIYDNFIRKEPGKERITGKKKVVPGSRSNKCQTRFYMYGKSIS